MVTAIVGANWGDEGKGKMTDLFAEQADLVVRFQGGANAGHTIINEYGRFVLHILPSGAFHPKAVNVIAPGVALNLDAFFRELDELVQNGGPTPNLKVSERTQVLMPYHVLFDQWEEARLGKNSFGSTKSGIAPFYSDKYAKIGFQVCDIFSPNLREKVERTVDFKNKVRAAVYPDTQPISADEMYDYLTKYRERLAPMVCDTTSLLHEALRQGKHVLLEGQLGSLRDPDNGIYPMVTSSSPLAGYAAVGAGLPAHEIKRVVTVAKAYSSCVGAGPFVSELFGAQADELRKRGGDQGEFGATTGRPRRVGWFDTVATRYGCMLQGTTDVALSVLDVLGYLDEIPICTGYEVDGEVIDYFPTNEKLERAKPVIETLPGWKCDISGIREYGKLPQATRDYVEFIERKIGYPITMVSNGPKRDDIIYRGK